MSKATIICFAGYALSASIITWLMPAGPTEVLFSYLGAIPIGMYCAHCDRKETTR